MSARKRPIRDVVGHDEDGGPVTLQRIRGMWHFANLCQWIYIFGDAAKIDNSLDIEEMETECLKPNSSILTDVALALLKLISAHRGLTCEILDEQLRKQYSYMEAEHNPFTGDQSGPLRFTELDIFTKIRVLQQLTQWAMVYPQRLRDKMEEQKDSEQTSWRIEPYGWDELDRTYYVLDDNRVYRLSDPPSPRHLKPKHAKKYRTGRQPRNRRGVSTTKNDVPSPSKHGLEAETGFSQDGLGGMEWECVAVTLEDVRSLIDGFAKTRDDNEKVLRNQLRLHLLPILEKHEESRKRREAQRERELVNLAKMANAKRSSRIASKVEQQKQEDQEKDEEENARETEAARRREQQTRLVIERERHLRMISREKRLRERESRRRMHEEELVQLSEGEHSTADGAKRISERYLQTQIDRTHQALEEIEQEQEDWIFDCVCGVHGQIDDGTHSVACEKCGIWQHSRCVGVDEEEAERPDFQFLCTPCRHDETATITPKKTKIKLKVRNPNRLEPEAGRSDEGLLRFANTGVPLEIATQNHPADVAYSSTHDKQNDPASDQEIMVGPRSEIPPSPASPSAQDLVPIVASTSESRRHSVSLKTFPALNTGESTANPHGDCSGDMFRGEKDDLTLPKSDEVDSAVALNRDAQGASAVTTTSEQPDGAPATAHPQEPRRASHDMCGSGIS